MTYSHAPLRLLLLLFFRIPLVLISVVLFPWSASGNGVQPEYGIKAAYIYHFTNFITWPEEVLEPTDPVRICVLGKNPFNGFLEPVTERTAGKHPLEVKYIDTLENQQPCQILFISSSKRQVMGSLLDDIRQKGVLTVGEMPDFALMGGIVGFVFRDGKIRLEINTRAARQANLKISAKLLEISTLVE